MSSMVVVILLLVMIVYATELYQLAREQVCLTSVSRIVYYPTTTADQGTYSYLYDGGSTSSIGC